MGQSPESRTSVDAVTWVETNDLCIGNRMNANAFRDLWFRVMF